MKLTKLKLGLVSLLLLSSCSSNRNLSTVAKVNIYNEDSTATIEKDSIVIKDTTVTTPSDSSQNEIKLEVDTTTSPPSIKDVAKTSSRSNRSSITNEVKNGVLKSKCNCDSVVATVRGFYKEYIKNIFTKQNSQVAKTDIKTVTKTEYRTPRVVKILAWIGGLAVAYLGFILFRKVRNFP